MLEKMFTFAIANHEKNKKTKKIDFCGSETEPDVLL